MWSIIVNKPTLFTVSSVKPQCAIPISIDVIIKAAVINGPGKSSFKLAATNSYLI